MAYDSASVMERHYDYRLLGRSSSGYNHCIFLVLLSTQEPSQLHSSKVCRYITDVTFIRDLTIFPQNYQADGQTRRGGYP